MAGGDLGDGNWSGGLVGSLLEIEGGGTSDIHGVGGGVGVGGVNTGKTRGRGEYWEQ